MIDAQCAELETECWQAKGKVIQPLMSVFIKPKPHMKNLSEGQENYHYANEGKYILLLRHQSPSLIQ